MKTTSTPQSCRRRSDSRRGHLLPWSVFPPHMSVAPAEIFALRQLVILLLLVPLPLFFAQTVFGKRGLEAWVVIGMIWAFCSAFTVILYPLWESKRELSGIGRGIILVSSSDGNENVFADFIDYRTSSQRAAGSLRRGPRRRRDPHDSTTTYHERMNR